MTEGDGQQTARYLQAIARLTKVPAWRFEMEQRAQVGAKAANGGAGRMGRLASAIASLPPDHADELIAALGEVTRPMTAREVEKALMLTDLNCRQRKAVVAALRPFDVVLLVPA